MIECRESSKEPEDPCIFLRPGEKFVMLARHGEAVHNSGWGPQKVSIFELQLRMLS